MQNGRQNQKIKRKPAILVTHLYKFAPVSVIINGHGGFVMRLTNLKEKKGWLILLTTIAVILTISTSVISGILKGRNLDIGIGEIPSSGITGSIQVISFLFCILMVFIDYKNGTKRAYFCLGLMFLGCAMSIVVSKQLGNFPGLVNCLLQMFSIRLISRQFEYSDKAAIMDSVTGLRNRYGFERTFERRIWLRDKGYLAYLHLGGVTAINSKHGRACGDDLLKIVAERMKTIVGKDGAVFKMEGAEFVIMLLADSDVKGILRKVVDEVEEKIVLNAAGVPVNCYLTVNMGVVDNIEFDYDAKTMMKNADTAMNYAMLDAKNNICIYNDAIKAKSERVMELENLVKESLINEYFYLVYQPQYFVDGKKLRGFETLIRMKLPDGTIVSPGEFIPVAENSNLCLSIDDYVINRALREFRDYIRNGKESFVLSINVSAKGISVPGFAKKIIDVIDEVGFPSECLEIEITEYSLVDSVEQTMENISLLRSRNIQIALDDFGSGYTSLAEVLKLPVNLIKIDKSLIDNVVEDETNRDFVKTVIYLGHLMECEVIAEGVEDDEQLSIIKEYNCDLVQGYVWSKPLEYEDALELV